MTTQRLHSNLAPIDLLTREEMEQTLSKGLDAAMRERVRGLDLARVPFSPISALAASVNLFTGNDQTPWGPEQGDIWMLRRVNVKSSALTDVAKYILYRGSTPSDISNAYTGRFLLEGFNPPANAVPTTPAVPASTVAQQNTNSYPVTVVITGGTATSTSVNGVVVGAGDGTYTVPAYGSISVTYSVAPTWAWTNASPTSLGLNVNLGFYPSTKAIFLFPGEQIYAQVNGATVGNQYMLDGEAIRVPAEMRGKIL